MAVTLQLHFLLITLFGLVHSLPSTSEKIEVPINEATKSPFLSVYHYPIKGNNLVINETHIFWPFRQKLYSKFYMKFTYDNQEMFGVSQQYYIEQRHVTIHPEINANFGATDHLHFVKAKGGLVNRNHESINMHDFDEDDADIPFLEQEISILKEKVSLLFPAVANRQSEMISKGYYFLADQIPIIKNRMNSLDVIETQEIKGMMDSFSANVTPKQLHGFQKSSAACLHIHTENFNLIEEHGRQGLWLPLNKSFLAFRSLFLNGPNGRVVIPLGITSYHVDDEQRNLVTVFKGYQMFTTVINGYPDTKNRLDVFNDGMPAIHDSRTSFPLKPPAYLKEKLESVMGRLTNNPCLPWASREKICPRSDFESAFHNVQLHCEDMVSLMGDSLVKCGQAFVDIFPCFNYLLRPEKKCSGAMNVIGEVTTVIHMMAEAPWDSVKTLALDKYLDRDFKKALGMFDCSNDGVTGKNDLMSNIQKINPHRYVGNPITYFWPNRNIYALNPSRHFFSSINP